jgi:FAD/FMN-containing dehydrogenase/Fe-S oxidoreductase
MENPTGPKAADGAWDKLQARVEGEVRTDTLSKTIYSTDASIYEVEPRGVVLPKTAADVVATIDFAAERGVPILPRGAGTSLAGQSVGSALHIDFSKYMSEILEFEPAERWIRVQPGLVLDELNAFLRPYHLQFAPDVATSSRANIGGMIGNNSSGAHSILYGKTIDHVLDLDVVLSDATQCRLQPLTPPDFETTTSGGGLLGRICRELQALTASHRDEIDRRFPRVMRRVSGYNLDEFIHPERPFDLTKIVVGSEGTLCAAVGARLNLVELPRHTALIACHFGDLNEALEANLEILPSQPAAVELVDKILLDQTKDSIEFSSGRDFLVGDPAALLFVEYTGNDEEELWSKVDGIEDQLRSTGFGYAFSKALEPGDQRRMWDLRKAGLGLLMGMKGDAKPNPGVEDTCVPVDRLPQYVRDVETLMGQQGITAQYYGHASVGVLHIRPIINLKSPTGISQLRLLQERMSDLVLELGGCMSAEHGDGLARSEWIPKMFGQEISDAFGKVKQLFDPRSIMNPGKIVEAPRMEENLRFGSGYRTTDLKTHFRFEREGSFQQGVELCSGVGHCRKTLVGTMCPSYMATLDEQHSTRGRANALRRALSSAAPDALTMPEVQQAMDLCLACKACKAECPSSVDMAKFKYEFLAHYGARHGYSVRSRLFAHIRALSRVASTAAPVANLIGRNRLNRWLLDRFLGIDRRRPLPSFARTPFSRWFNGRSYVRSGSRGKLLLFVDTFVEFNEPQIGIAATIILERAGFQVELAPRQVCCGRPMLSNGFLDKAKERAVENLDLLAPYVEKGYTIVGMEPSCLSTLTDDYLDLLEDERAQVVAAKVVLLEEFLIGLQQKGDLGLEFARTPKTVLVHGHCHQKAANSVGATVGVLELPPNFQVSEIRSGCCGMAGSFGYEKEHYEVSMKIGQERLFKPIREAGPEVEVVAAGTSCRHQISDATGRRARHWAELLVEVLQ